MACDNRRQLETTSNKCGNVSFETTFVETRSTPSCNLLFGLFEPLRKGSKDMRYVLAAYDTSDLCASSLHSAMLIISEYAKERSAVTPFCLIHMASTNPGLLHDEMSMVKSDMNPSLNAVRVILVQGPYHGMSAVQNVSDSSSQFCSTALNCVTSIARRLHILIFHCKYLEIVLDSIWITGSCCHSPA